MWQHIVTSRWATDASPQSPLRVLIETCDPLAQISDFTAFREAGFEIALCSGPTVRPCECPLVRGDQCRLVDEADAVLVELDLRDPLARGVVEALVASHPDTPVVVAAPRRFAEVGSLPEGVIRLPVSASVGGQVRVLRTAALDGRRARTHRA